MREVGRVCRYYIFYEWGGFDFIGELEVLLKVCSRYLVLVDCSLNKKIDLTLIFDFF